MSMDMNQAPAEEWWRRLEAVLAQGFSRCVLIARERAIDGTSFDFHTNKFFSQVTRGYKEKRLQEYISQILTDISSMNTWDDFMLLVQQKLEACHKAPWGSIP